MKNNSFYLQKNDPKQNQKRRIPTNIKVPAIEYNNYRHSCETQKKGTIKVGDRFRLNSKTGKPGQTGLYLEITYANPNAVGKNRRYKLKWVYCRLT